MTSQIFIAGPVGQIEIFEDRPQNITAIAVVTHPHPLMGGNPQHKVPQLITDILVEQGCLVWRPSFRGSGQSSGVHDDGVGESLDTVLICEELQKRFPNLPFYGGGFSFGAHVWVRTFEQLAEHKRPLKLVLAGLPTGLVRSAVNYQTPSIESDILLVHGEQDDITLLADVINWAKPQRHPITIMPGANHFFTGYLKPLRLVLERYLQINKA